MRKRLIVANWKMNMLKQTARDFSRKAVELMNEIGGGVDIVIAPPFPLLETVFGVINKTNIQLGAQNVFWKDAGAFTGEVSPLMLRDVGCKWVIIGHSERRSFLSETDRMVRDKVSVSLKYGLTPIVCVGESLEEREEAKTIRQIEGQIIGSLRDQELDDNLDLVVAYEPIWAIGTGKNATSSEIGYVHGIIRDLMFDIFGDLANRIRILYGGSVTTENISEILASKNVDGALVGGASLDVYNFAGIVRVAGE